MPTTVTEHKREEPCAKFLIRAETVDKESRSVEATLTTDQPVPVFDYETFDIIDEVLETNGGDFPSQVPLLAVHNRESLDDVIGSVRNPSKGRNEWKGRLFFASNDEVADRAWNKVLQGHLTDVSIGYRVNDFIDIPKGEDRKIGNRRYKAKDRKLRIATSWAVREVSVVPIGADSNAKLREKVLPSIRSKEMAKENEKAKTPADDKSAESVTIEETRETTLQELVVKPPVVKPPAEDAGAIARKAIEDERKRCNEIRALSAGVPEEVVTRCLSEGVSADEAAKLFIVELQKNKPEPTRTGAAIHVKGTTELAALKAGMLMRESVDPVKGFVDVDGGNIFKRAPKVNSEDLERAAEAGWKLRDMPLADVLRMCLNMHGIHPAPGTQAVLSAYRDNTRAATGVSFADVTNVFTTTLSASLLQAYESAPDTTQGWCREADVPNFQTNERVRLGKGDALSRHARGAEATHVAYSDAKEEYKIARYTGQFVVDEQDIIDDRFGALNSHTPAELGDAARQLRPELVYAILADNPNMRDSNALFDATNHTNLRTSAGLAEATLKTAILDMVKQQENGRTLNLQPAYIIVPAALKWTCMELLGTAQRVVASTSTVNVPAMFAVAREGLIQVTEPRLDNGFTDPSDGSSVAADANNWYLTAAAGRNTIEVGYLRGTGRAPQVRSFILTQGQWGIGWDIAMDIGAKALDWRGLHRNEG